MKNRFKNLAWPGRFGRRGCPTGSAKAGQIGLLRRAQKAPFWSVLEHLQTLQPTFGGNRRPKFAFRFKRLIHVVDSTTIQLMARSLDWAKHRRRKAAAKCHVRLDLQTFLPRCAIVATAGEHDNRRARELCANVQAGEIVIFDKAYLDFAHLADLSQRGIFWVTRAKDNLQCRVVRKFQDGAEGNILRDDLIVLTNPAVQAVYPVELRRVTALVEVDGQWREMVFLTNNLEWSAQTIADLYRCRWSIEVFFKELKQTLQLADFLGHNANAVKWQVWTALLAYVLLRFCAHLGQWGHSFTRLFALVRSALWQKLELRSLLQCYGTADGGELLGHFRIAPTVGVRQRVLGRGVAPRSADNDPECRRKASQTSLSPRLWVSWA